MNPKNRPYIFHEATTSICPSCLRTLPAKVVIKDSAVYILKSCPEHGEQLELLEEDLKYFLSKHEFNKPGTISKTQSGINRGCPYDCGLCPAHDQHTCIGLIEVTNNCNLNCRTCYANAGSGEFLSLTRIAAMMDFYQESEFGKAEILQLSGGEPTIHPQIIEIIKLAKVKKFKYVMLNTNGLRIAADEEFVKELSQFNGGFEIYLQFDGFKKQTHTHFRGRDLTEIKRKAVANLVSYKIPITLVATVENGINDHEVGPLIDYGIKTKYIRGINFQPVAFFGRYPEAKFRKRLTLSGLLRQIEIGTNGRVKIADFIPLPCNVERVALTYLYRQGTEFVPITRSVNIREYLPVVNNTFTFYLEDILRNVGEKTVKGEYYCECMRLLKDLKQFVPFNFSMKSKAERCEFVEENTFRISVTSFIDAYNFDIKAMQKECVHIITPDLRKIPFSAYNLIHRGGSDHSSETFPRVNQDAV